MQVGLLVNSEGQVTGSDLLQYGDTDVKGGPADPLGGQAQLLDGSGNGDAVAATAREHELDVWVAVVPGLGRRQCRAFGGTDRDLDEVDPGRLEHAGGSVHSGLLVERPGNTDHAAHKVALFYVGQDTLGDCYARVEQVLAYIRLGIVGGALGIVGHDGDAEAQRLVGHVVERCGVDNAAPNTVDIVVDSHVERIDHLRHDVVLRTGPCVRAAQERAHVVSPGPGWDEERVGGYVAHERELVGRVARPGVLGRDRRAEGKFLSVCTMFCENFSESSEEWDSSGGYTSVA